ncbi:MAG: SagB/ThcOx family dehydrogenase [Thermoguttaceae bacterium]|nr:SagB/ThcOx family dehydrogenase [Thermoguttaceae bacterium]
MGITRRNFVTAGTAAVCGLALVSGSAQAQPVVEGERIELPTPRKTGGMPLLDALSTRKTTRVYSSRMLDAQTLSSLLWAAFGISREDGRRTAPSALNSQEIQIYVILEGGIYVYEPKEHALERKLEGDFRKLAGTQSYAQSVPVSFVYVADLEKSLTSPESSESYACVDCGFIGQNVYLFAAANGLSSAFRGSIDRSAIAETLKLKASQRVLYGQSIGYTDDEILHTAPIQLKK